MNNYPKKVPDTFSDKFGVDSDNFEFPSLPVNNSIPNFFNDPNIESFGFNNGLSSSTYTQSDLFSKMNKSATKTEFVVENRSLFKDEELKTTRSGVVYDTPKAETIIDNPGIYEPLFDFFSSRKCQSIKTPFGRQSKHEKSTWMQDIKTDGLYFGGMDERASRSGKVFSKKYDKKESFPEETEFDKETITNLKKCLQEESLKRTVVNIETKSILTVVKSNKEFTLDLTKKTTCPVSYQPKNEEVGNYDHDYSLGVRWEDCAPCGCCEQPYGSNYGNKNMTSFRAPEENHGLWNRKFEFNPSAGECFVNNLTPGQECMNPNEAFSKSPKKIKLSTLKKESIKNHICNHKGCAQKFDRVGQG